MVNSVTIDSSVIISSLLPKEERQGEACQIWGRVLSGETPAVMLDSRAAAKACKIATKTGLRGMDALVVQVAKEYKTELITFDKEMLQKAASIL